MLLIGFTSECSDVEEPGFFAVGEAAHQACAEETNQDSAEATPVIIDGGRPVDLQSDGFGLPSPQTTVQLPENNKFGVPRADPGRRSSAACYPGSMSSRCSSSATIRRTLTLNVVRRDR